MLSLFIFFIFMPVIFLYVGENISLIMIMFTCLINLLLIAMSDVIAYHIIYQYAFSKKKKANFIRMMSNWNILLSPISNLK